MQLIPNGVTVHLSKQSAEGGGGSERKREGQRKEERKGRERESIRENKSVREGWQGDSQCTITLVFRPGQLKSPPGHGLAYTFSLH